MIKTSVILISLVGCFISSPANSQTLPIKQLTKLIIEWGKIENEDPYFAQRNSNSDSIFIDITKQILTKAINCDSLLSSKINSLNRYTKGNKSDYNQSIVINERRVSFSEQDLQLRFTSNLTFSNPFPEISYRLLALEKIYNNIKFYHPYRKDVIPTCPNSLIKEFVRKMFVVKNFNEYNTLLMEFISNFNDSHIQLNNNLFNDYFGKRSVPIKARYIHGKVIVTDIFPKDSNHFLIKKGDIITAVNGQRISNKFNSMRKYIPHSNKTCLYRDLITNSLNTNDETLSISIKRNATILEVKLKTYNQFELFELEKENKINNAIRLLKPKVLYLNCKFIDTTYLDKYLRNNRDLDYLIVDLRGSTQWIKPIIDKYLYPMKTIFAEYYTPNIDSPGLFNRPIPLTMGPSNRELLIKNVKVIVLVNEFTQSQGEFQAMFLQSIPNSLTIGSKTSGTDGNVSNFEVPGNIKISMTAVGITYPNGIKANKKGIRVTTKVNLSIKEATLGIDKEFIETLKIINKGS